MTLESIRTALDLHKLGSTGAAVPLEIIAAELELEKVLTLQRIASALERVIVEDVDGVSSVSVMGDQS